MHLLRPLVLGIIMATAASAAHASVGDVSDVATLWRTRNDVNTDNFYTIDPSQRDLSISCCGYYAIGAVAYLLRTENPYVGVMGFARYWKGAPQVEHFYTHLLDERANVESWGWIFERIEGGVFRDPFGGLAPFHRLNKYNGVNGDMQHHYTTTQAEVTTLRNQGWGYDGIKGHVLALRPIYDTVKYNFRDSSGTQLVLTVPPIRDISGSTTSLYNACGGEVQVTINGQPKGTYSNWTWGSIPGQAAAIGCYAYGPDINRSQTNTVVLTHTGFAAKVTPTSSVAFWDITPPTARTATIAASNAAKTAGVASDEILVEQAYSDPLTVQMFLEQFKQAEKSTTDGSSSSSIEARVPLH